MNRDTKIYSVIGITVVFCAVIISLVTTFRPDYIYKAAIVCCLITNCVLIIRMGIEYKRECKYEKTDIKYTVGQAIKNINTK